MRHSTLLALSLTALLAAGCTRQSATPEAATPAATPEAAAMPAVAAETDEHSYAQPDTVKTTDLALDLAIDFASKQIAGTATYTLDWLDKAAMQLVLDTRDLTIDKIEGEAAGQWTPLQFALAPADKTLGSKLTIETPARNAKVRVTYTTSPQASGLQWLEPSMTAGKKTPFMFSQSQQIHARSWVPLQDTPRVRFTYTAHVTSPENAMVLMSADNDPKAARDGDYTFAMPQKIPSYLLAIAAGDMVFEPISARAGVWAEP
ncbi:MAG: aminopeptidase, partial [Luteimonas sp.]